MDTKNPLWYELIEKFKDAGKIRNGLTIPFLVGAYTMQNDNIDLQASDCVKLLLNDIAENSANKTAKLRICPYIQEIIIEIIDKYQHKDVNTFQNLLIKQDAINDMSDEDKNNIDKICEYLYNDYKEYIMAKKFSVINKEWKEYSNEEKTLIEKVINNIK